MLILICCLPAKYEIYINPDSDVPAISIRKLCEKWSSIIPTSVPDLYALRFWSIH